MLNEPKWPLFFYFFLFFYLKDCWIQELKEIFLPLLKDGSQQISTRDTSTGTIFQDKPVQRSIIQQASRTALIFWPIGCATALSPRCIMQPTHRAVLAGLVEPHSFVPRRVVQWRRAFIVNAIHLCNEKKSADTGANVGPNWETTDCRICKSRSLHRYFWTRSLVRPQKSLFYATYSRCGAVLFCFDSCLGNWWSAVSFIKCNVSIVCCCQRSNQRISFTKNKCPVIKAAHFMVSSHTWRVGRKLHDTINASGFHIQGDIKHWEFCFAFVRLPSFCAENVHARIPVLWSEILTGACFHQQFAQRLVVVPRGVVQRAHFLVVRRVHLFLHISCERLQHSAHHIRISISRALSKRCSFHCQYHFSVLSAWVRIPGLLPGEVQWKGKQWEVGGTNNSWLP